MSARAVLAPAFGYLVALAMAAGATAIAAVASRYVSPSGLSLVFVVPVVIAAVGFGLGPALTAAAGGALAFNFFLIPPFYTLRIADPGNASALALMLLIAAMVSALAARSRKRALDAAASAEQASALESLGRTLAGARDPRAIAQAGVETLSRRLRAPAAVVLVEDGELEVVGAVLSPDDLEAARWALATRLPTRSGAYPIEAARFDFWPTRTPLRRAFIVGAAISGQDEGRPAHAEAVVAAVIAYLGLALDREDAARELMRTRLRQAGEELKADLLAAVSHDLKTPLSTILVTLQSLRRFGTDGDPALAADLLALAEAETTRLADMVSKILDMGRIEAGGVTVESSATPAAELVEGALKRAAGALQGRDVVIEVDPALTMQVDPALFECALANIVENAAKYAPAGPIAVRSGQDADETWIEVLDEGPGFPGPIGPLLEKFARGVSGDGRPPGVGLGLAIARGFLEVQGGRLEAGPRVDRTGARVRLVAPRAEPVV